MFVWCVCCYNCLFFERFVCVGVCRCVFVRSVYDVSCGVVFLFLFLFFVCLCVFGCLRLK